MLIPVALALYGAVLLLPLVERLWARGIPRLPAAGIVMLALALVLASLVNVTVDPAQDWIRRAPKLLSEVEQKLRPLRQAAVQLDKVAAGAERIAGEERSTKAPPPPTPSSEGFLRKTLGVVVPLVGVFFMILFLLACGPPILQRIADSRTDDASARRVLVIGERVRREMSRYLGTLAIINVFLGTATTLLCMGFGLPNPALWGVMAALFNFVPYVGSATTLVVLTTVALLSIDLNHAIAVALCYLALDILEGQLVQPLAVGHRLSLNPLAIFLALWVGAGLWGVAGLLLATPILLTVRIICRRIPRCKTLTAFLAPIRERPLAQRARAWQRRRRRRARSSGVKPVKRLRRV